MSATGRSAVLRGALAGVLASLVPLVVHAQPASDKAFAESLFREGRALMAAGETHEGCVKLEGSYRIDAKTGTLTNLAACHELEGKTASAWAEFTEAAARAATTRRTALEQLARSRAAALEPRLARIAIRVPDARRAETMVTLDGRPVVAEALDGAIPIDPGPHELRAVRGEAAWSSSVVVEGGPSRVEIVVPELAAPPLPAASVPAPIAPPPPPAPRTSTRRAVSYGLLGAGAVGLLAGTVLGVQAMSKKSDADGLCDGAVCASQHGVDLQEEARTRATWATVGIAAGVVAAAVGLYLFVTEPHRTSLVGRF